MDVRVAARRAVQEYSGAPHEPRLEVRGEQRLQVARRITAEEQAHCEAGTVCMAGEEPDFDPAHRGVLSQRELTQLLQKRFRSVPDIFISLAA